MIEKSNNRRNVMTVKELINHLRTFDEEHNVIVHIDDEDGNKEKHIISTYFEDFMCKLLVSE